MLTHLLAQQILLPRVVRTELGDSEDIPLPKARLDSALDSHQTQVPEASPSLPLRPVQHYGQRLCWSGGENREKEGAGRECSELTDELIGCFLGS